MDRGQGVKKKNYDEDTLREAVQLVKGKRLSAYKAAKLYSIPKTTILDHLKERYAYKLPGPARMLDLTEEEALVAYIKYMGRHGFPPRRSDVRLTINELMRRKGTSSLFAAEGPSDKWFRGFLARQPDLREKVPQIRQRARSIMTNEHVIDEFFVMYKELIAKLGLEGKPGQIYNCDETGFAAKDRAREKAIGVFREDCIQDEVISIDHVTAHVTISAAGRVLPTMIIYQGSFPTRTAEEDVPDDWLFASTKSGYIDRDLFHQWFLELFIPNCGIRKPVLLIMDNHDTHINIDVIDKAREHQIEILALPPHTTHLLQPLDVMFFGPVKRQVYKNARSMCVANTNMVVNRRLLPKVLNTSMNQVCSPSFVQSSFAKAGLVPCDSMAIDRTKLRPSTKTHKAACVDTGREDDSVLCPSCGRIDNPHPVFMVRQLDKSLQGAFPTPQEKPTTEKRRKLNITKGRALCTDEWRGKIKAAKDKAVQDQEDLQARKIIREANRTKRLAEKEERQRKAQERKLARQQRLAKEQAAKSTKAPRGRGKKLTKRPAPPPSSSESDQEVISESDANDDEGSKEVCGVCLSADPPQLSDDEEEGQVDWLACDHCGQWYHVGCLGANRKLNAKDEFVCYDCFNDEENAAKRLKTDTFSPPAVPSGGWLTKMASWVTRSKKSFHEQFFVGSVEASPLEEDAQHHRNGHRTDKGATSNTASHTGHNVSTLSQYPTGYKFTPTQADIHRSDICQFSSDTDSMEFKAPPVRMAPSTTITVNKPALVRPSTRGAAAQRGNQHGTQSRLARSIFEKTYRRGPRPSYSQMRDKNQLAARECVRMQERRKYEELLQCYTATPCSRLLSGSASISRYSAPITRSKDAFTPPDDLLVDDTLVAPKADRRTSLLPFDNKENHFQLLPQQTSTPLVVGRPLLHPPDVRRSPRVNSDAARARPVTIDLTRDDRDMETSKSLPVSPFLRPIGKGDGASIDSSSDRSASPSHRSFIKNVKDNKYVKDTWIKDLCSKFAEDKLGLERSVAEENIKLKYFQEKREEWEDQLEDRIRRRLTLAERQKPVLEEEFVEEEEEEEYNEFPELDGDQIAMVTRAWGRGPSGEVLADGFKLSITRQDLYTLKGLNWLNDEVINFYMSLLIERSEKEGFAPVHAFNTFFYPKLMRQGHSGLRRWTKSVDLFSKTYILVPVHLAMHWCLAVVDLGKKELRYYDSMGGRNDPCLNALRQYLMDEHQDKKKTPLDMNSWKSICLRDIPQQMNGSDCGMFACKFAEYNTRGAEPTFSQEHMPYFRQRMTYEIMSKALL